MDNCRLAEAALAKLDPDFTFWTDGSVLESDRGGSSCVSYNSYINPYKKQRLFYNLTLCITRPAGRLCSLMDVEVGGIDSALDNILANKSTYTRRVL
jgi:hypothetical protein